MSELEKITQQIRLATDYQTNKRILREKIQSDLHFTYNGGLFKADPSVYAFVYAWPDSELFLEDTYNNPIRVNKQEFIDKCTQHYQMVMNTWHIQHEEIRRARKV